MVLAKEHFPVITCDTLPDVVRHPELVSQPQRHRHEVGPQPSRGSCGVGLKQSVELDERLLVETNQVEIASLEAGLMQTVLDGARWEAGVVFLAGEPFFLCRGRDLAVFHKTGGRIVVIRRKSQDACRQSTI